MLKTRHIAIRAAVVLAGLALASPTSGAAAGPKAQSYNRCIEHYGLEWREWAAKSRQKKAGQLEQQRHAAQERAAAWDELATSPGINAELALSYRKKADALRASASENIEIQAPVTVDQDELAEFCNEVVAVLIAPDAASTLAPAPAPKAQATTPNRRKKVRVAAKPRRIRRARAVQRLRTRPRLSLGIGFIGIGF